MRSITENILPVKQNQIRSWSHRTSVLFKTECRVGLEIEIRIIRTVLWKYRPVLKIYQLKALASMHVQCYCADQRQRARATCDTDETLHDRLPDAAATWPDRSFHLSITSRKLICYPLKCRTVLNPLWTHSWRKYGLCEMRFLRTTSSYTGFFAC